MYKLHEAFNTPEERKKIWRYMDFIKFTDMIDRGKLYFTTADRLGDPFEGSLPKAYIEYFNANLDSIFRPETWNFINREKAPKGFSRARRLERKFIAVSCWNMQEEESAALWQMYCNKDNGIAIQSTIQRLKESLRDEERDINIGEIEYIDYYSQPASDLLTGNAFVKPSLYKGKSFEFEHEVRAIVQLPILKIVGDSSAKFITGHEGYYVTIDCNLLIENVYISPMSSKWQKQVVKALLNKYGLKKRVRQSDLSRKPIF